MHFTGHFLTPVTLKSGLWIAAMLSLKAGLHRVNSKIAALLQDRNLAEQSRRPLDPLICPASLLEECKEKFSSGSSLVSRYNFVVEKQYVFTEL
jgi:hypothetical protein